MTVLARPESILSATANAAATLVLNGKRASRTYPSPSALAMQAISNLSRGWREHPR